MAGEPKKVPARFYRSASGAEPVRDWLQSLSKDDRKEIRDGYRHGRVRLAGGDADVCSDGSGIARGTNAP
jgi:hypothetical protein